MAQRNQLNERYTGSGPVGQTRKSASSAKPVSAAAASVRMKGKPETASQKRAAEQERKDRIAKKAAERQRKSAKNQQQLKITETKAKQQRGELSAEEAEAEILSIENNEQEKAQSKFSLFKKKDKTEEPEIPTSGRYQDDPEYKKWRKVNMALVIGSIIAVLPVFYFAPKSDGGKINFVLLIPAYICIATSFWVDSAKTRPIMQAYQTQRFWEQEGKLSPKQQKHAAARRSRQEQQAKAKLEEKASRRRWGKKPATEVAEVAEVAETVEATEATETVAATETNSHTETTISTSSNSATSTSTDNAVTTQVKEK